MTGLMAKLKSIRKNQVYSKRNLSRSVSTLSLGALMMAAVIATPVHAERNAKVKSIAFNAVALSTNEIVIEARDYRNWNSIQDSNIKIDFDIDITLRKVAKWRHNWRQRVERWAIYSGWCSNFNCTTKQLLKSGAPQQYDRFATRGRILTSAKDLFRTFGPGIASAEAAKIFNRCTNDMSPRPPNGEDYVFHHNMRISLIANTSRGLAEASGNPPIVTGDTGKSAEITLKIRCKGIRDRTVDERPAPLLTIKEFAVRPLSSAPACPRPYKLDATFRLREPFKPGPQSGLPHTQPKFPIKFNVELNGKKGPRIKRAFLPGQQELHYSENLKLDPGTNTIRIIVKNGPTSRTITRKVKCGPLRLISSNLSYAQTGPCPKKVFETATFVFNQPGLTAFKIRTQAGVTVHQGNLEIKRHGDIYKAVSVRQFNSGAVNMLLRAEIVGNTSAASGWTPLEITCPTPGPSTIAIAASSRAACPKQVSVDARYTMRGINQSTKMLANITCNNGQSKQKLIFMSPRTGGKMKLAFDVGNSISLNCTTHLVGYYARTIAAASREIQCSTPPGASDLTDQQPDHSEPGVGEKLIGRLTFIDKQRSKRCPRDIVASAQIRLKRNVPVHWSIDCKSGSRSGVAQPKSVGDGYLVNIRRSVSLGDGENGRTYEQCVLRTVSPGSAKTLAHRQQYFTCRSRNVESGSDGVTATSTPTHTPTAPIPPRIVDCRRGYQRIGDRCVREPCRTGFRRVGERCQKISIVCARGYKKVGNRCVQEPCRRGFKRVGQRCQKISIICRRGYKKVGNRCVQEPCRRGFKRVGQRCQKISIICRRGYKKVGSRCVLKPCRRGFKRVGQRCQKITIVCRRGFRKVGNRCVQVPCRPGFRRVGQRCQRVAIVCPRGFRKVGNRCRPSRPPGTRPCRRGQIRINGRCIRPAR